MPGELQFFLGSKDAQAGQCPVVRRLLNKHGLRKVHFSRDREHLVVGQSVSIGNDRERVALKSRGGENIQSEKTMVHLSSVLSARLSERGALDPLELADGPFVDNVSRVPRGPGFQQQNVRFLIRNW